MYKLSFKFITQYFGLLLEGMERTIIIVVCSFIISFILGIVIALFRNSKAKSLKVIGACWVNFLRNTPFLVQLFFVFYGLPVLGIQTDPMITAIIALGISTSAGNCEVIRSGLLSCKKGYYETAAALGFTPIKTLKTIIIPIALRLSFKPMTSNLINLILTSSIVFSITVMETMGAAKTISARTARPFEVYLIILVSYCILTFFVAFVAKRIDKKISITL